MSFVLVWLGVMFPLVFSPGPANIVFAASGARVGLIRSLPLMLGVDLIFILKSLLVGFGFGNLLQSYPIVLQLLQIVGALYIVWLAVGFLRSSLQTSESEQKTLGFKDGLIIQLLNSKGWLMVVLMFSLFTEPALSSFGEFGVIMLVLLLALLNISVHLAWISVGSLLTGFMSEERHQKLQGRLFFVCLLLVAAWLFVDNSIWDLFQV